MDSPRPYHWPGAATVSPPALHSTRRLTPRATNSFILPDVLQPHPHRPNRPRPPARRGRPGTTARSCTSSSPWALTSPRPSTAKLWQNPPPPQSQPEDEPAAPSPSPTQATTFDRLARTVRRTVALARKLSEPAREAPGPKLRLNECPHERRADRAETDALHAELCERPEAPDCDADEDLDDDLDEQSFADLIASLRHDSGLATLTDAQLWQHRARPSAQDGAPGERCGPCACAAGLTSAPPRITHPTHGTPRPGTGPPRP